MQIEFNAGTVEVGNLKELETVVYREIGKPNEIWLHDVGDKNPALCILASGGFFYGLFFPASKHPGYNSLSKDMSESSGGETVFSMHGDVTEISNRYLISKSEVIEICRDFFRDRSLPKSIKWEEL